MGVNQPDVRVRLSAEGQKEIVDAFRQVQKQAERTGKRGAKGFNRLNQSLQTFKKILPTITVIATAAAASILVLTKRTIDAADRLAKMSQRTGIAVETLSALGPAAELAGANLEDVGTGLARLARTVSDAGRGLETARRPFRDLGIEVANADGTLRPLEEILDDVSRELAKMENGTKKTALAQELMGRGGVKLIPLLNDLGKRGFAAVTQEAEAMGLVLSGPTARAAEDFNDNFGRMKFITLGVANSIAKEVLPVLVTLTDQIVQAGKDTDKIVSIGTKIGRFITGLIAFFSAFKTTVKIAALGLGTFGQAALKVIQLDFAAARAIVAQGHEEMQAAAVEGALELERIYTAAAQRIGKKAETRALQTAQTVKKVVSDLSRIQVKPLELRPKFDPFAVAGVIEELREFVAGLDLTLTPKLDLPLPPPPEAALLGELGEQVGDQFASGFARAVSQGEELRGVIQGIAQDLVRMLTQRALSSLFGNLFGGFLGGAGGGGGAPGGAGGGLIRGPGTSTSDSIPVRLSDREYVVRAKVVDEPGVLAYLERLNREGRPALRRIGPAGFAEGGLVELAGAPARAGANANAKADLTIGLDETLLLKRLEANSEFSRILIRTMDRHQKKFSNVLGRGIR